VKKSFQISSSEQPIFRVIYQDVEILNSKKATNSQYSEDVLKILSKISICNFFTL